jgi:hypothetical protein
MWSTGGSVVNSIERVASFNESQPLQWYLSYMSSTYHRQGGPY